MGGPCNVHGRDEKYTQTSNRKPERDSLTDLGIRKGQY
jgi:hypothetical protein